jgi:hypothetical protein
MRSRFWVMLDCSMLLAFVVLQSWQLTGVVVHEWLAAALIGGLLAHLLLHWSWVETRSRRVLAPRSRRTRRELRVESHALRRRDRGHGVGFHDFESGAAAASHSGELPEVASPSQPLRAGVPGLPRTAPGPELEPHGRRPWSHRKELQISGRWLSEVATDLNPLEGRGDAALSFPTR